MRERKCIVSGETLPETGLIRFVADADGQVLVDIRSKAPGRGVWVTANRESIELALTRKGFVRGFKRQVQVPNDLGDQVEQQLRGSCLDLLGMARRSGQLLSGYEKVRAELRKARPGWLIEAADGSADGRNKILALGLGLWDDVPLVGCFAADALGQALGREQATHVLVQESGVAERLGLALARLSGFTPLIPLHWGQKDG